MVEKSETSQAITVLSESSVSGPAMAMLKKMTTKQLYLALRDRQIEEKDVAEIIDSLVGLVAVEVVGQLNRAKGA